MSEVQKSRIIHQSMLRASTTNQSDFMDMVGKRIGSCRSTMRSNCLGTSFYIVGERDTDECIDLDKDTYERHLKGLKRPSAPTEGCLIAWHVREGKSIYTLYVGVVTSKNPLLVTTRHSIGGELVENREFRELNGPFEYMLNAPQILFYLPSALKIS
jgi:hypothetical protein